MLRERKRILMQTKNKKGFTLVEVVVVIAIVGILASILIPSIAGWVRRSREKQIIGNTKSILNAAAAAVGFAYAETGFDDVLTTTYNGHKCGVITTYDMQQAQLGGTPTTIDGRIAKSVVDAVIPNGDGFNFADFIGGSNGPMGSNLISYEATNPKTPGFVMIFNESGEIERLEYSMGNQLCVFDDGYHVFLDDSADAIFTSV